MIKLWNTLRLYTTKRYTDEYLLKLESYKYKSESHTYLLDFRQRMRFAVKTVSINDVVCNNQLLSTIHPVDAYIIGMLYGMQYNRIILKSNFLTFFKDYASYQLIAPTLFMDNQSLINSEHIILKPKNGNRSLKVQLLELARKPFLLHAVGSRAACQLGFYASEKFIMELN